jgi:hypothetical protein
MMGQLNHDQEQFFYECLGSVVSLWLYELNRKMGQPD